MSATKFDVSVVICTYAFERWNDLVAALGSVQSQSAQPREIIIVVDHNPALFLKAQSSLSHSIVIENTGPKGLSGARNTGLGFAKGGLIAFFDDDEILAPDCLAKLINDCDQPGSLGAGGKILPNWLSPKPAWFPDEFGWALGYSYRGLPEKTAPVRNLFGGSMCFHRTVFEEVGGFRSEIGRINKKPLGCEETELCIRALQHWPDGKLIYEPEATVLHSTPPERANWRYFLRRCFYEGVSKATVARFVGSRKGLSSERRYTVRVLPAGIMKGLSDFILRRDPSGVGRAFAILTGLVCTTAGYLYGSLQGFGVRFTKPQRERAAKGTA